jgi:hypothetical protein
MFHFIPALGAGRRTACSLTALWGASILLPALAAAPAQADTATVRCDKAQSLQDAIGAADTDTILVEGTCIGPFTINHDLTITGIPSATLDGKGAGTVVTVESGVTVKLANLTVQNGSSDFGGGIYNDGTLSLTNSSVTRNSAAQLGGGIYNDGTLRIENSIVSQNTAYLGAGICSYCNFGNRPITPLPAVTLNNSIVSKNTASLEGGGIVNAGGTLTLINGSSVSQNTASMFAGGITNSFGGKLTLNSSSVSQNSVSRNNGPFSGGGGILNLQYPDPFDGFIRTTRLKLNDSIVSNNTAFVFGGGILNAGGMLTLTGSIVSKNTASADGGGIDNAYVPGVGIGVVTLDDSTVKKNTPDDCSAC